ncbi:MAG: BON domain-containing protein [Gammaproteobacteria bacterium]|nr:BON domain-containing protein [Gammaproteobacteria bacterium]MDH3767081.1 BON domain-containing protein [Gammaproteobacteria bacterium]
MSNTFRIAVIVLTAAFAGGCTALVLGGAAAGGYAVGKDDRQVGTIIDDGTITASVKTKLIRSNHVSAGKVNVDTHDGVVTLNGIVESYVAREQAELLATDTKGVKSVVNKLEVKPESGG